MTPTPETLAASFRHRPGALTPEVVVEAVLPLLENHGHALLVALREAPLPCIRALLGAFETRSDFLTIFVRASTANAANDDALVRAWRYAFTKCGEIEAIRVARNARKILVRHSKEPRLINPLIATLATGVNVSSAWFALALASGDEAVIDALLPHVEAARDDDEVLDGLHVASSFAPTTAAFEVLTARIEALMTRRAERSALGQVLRARGVETINWAMRLQLRSNELIRFAPMGLSLTFDTTDARVLSTHGLSMCLGASFPPPQSAADIPQWLGRRAAALGVTWNWPGRLCGTLKGEEYARFSTWLAGG